MEISKITGLHGITCEIAKRYRALHAGKLVYLTMNTDPELALETFHRGASGYLLKTCAASELVVAVRGAEGEQVFNTDAQGESHSPTLGAEKTGSRGRTPYRKTEGSFGLLAEGKVMEQIGCSLNMTARTVAFHKYRIMEILSAKSSAEFVRCAIRDHIVAA